MESNNSGYDMVSEQAHQVADNFANESLRGHSADYLNSNPQIQPVSLEDYKIACSEFLGGIDPLPDSLLQKRIEHLMQDSKLKMRFPAGWSCCLAVIPFSNFGLPLTDEEIQNGDHLRLLIVDPSGATIDGFSATPSFTSRVLPDDIQAASFQIPQYESEEIYAVSENDRANLSIQLSHSFKKLQQLLK